MESINKIISEIGDTPRGQYMLGRLSQSYDEPNLYTDDYDEKPEIASYASDNWHGYGRGDDNENAFNLGKSDEEGVRWIDDGSQRRFRERHGLPPMNRQLHKESKHTDMNKKLIRLTESDLHRIVKESVGKILKEMDLNPRMNMNAFDAHGRGLTSKSHTPNSPRRRATIKQQNLGGVNVDAVNKVLYPNQTPQMAKDQLKRKLYGESVNNATVRREKMLQKYGRFNDGSDNPYSDEGRYYKHLETEPQGIEEGRYYNPRTYERDENKEFTHDEIMKLLEILKQNPIEERWKPYDFGFCKVQRVEANNASGTHYLLNPSKTYDPNRPDDSYCDGNNGTIYLQIGRLPNTHWLDDSGYTYMCWKW